MASFVLRNVCMSIDGTRLETAVREVEIAQSAADVSVTAMGAGGEQHLAGIRDDKITLTMYSDFASSAVHQTLNTKFQNSGTVEVKITASGSTVGTTNPIFIGYCPVLTYSPINGAVGDPSMTTIELPCNGTITTATGGTL